MNKMIKNIGIDEFRAHVSEMFGNVFILRIEQDKAIFTNGDDTLNMYFKIVETAILKAKVMDYMVSRGFKIIHISENEIVFAQN